MTNLFKTSILFFLILINFPVCTSAQKEIKALDNILSQLEKQDDTTRLKILEQLCWDYRFIEPLKSFEFGIEALIIAEKAGKFANMANINNYLGLLYRNIEAYDHALNHFNEAFKIADSINNITVKAYALNNSGNVYYLQGKFNEALPFLLEALQLFKSEKNLVGEAYCYNQLGLLYFWKKDYDNSINYHLQALSIRNLLMKHANIPNLQLLVVQLIS